LEQREPEADDRIRQQFTRQIETLQQEIYYLKEEVRLNEFRSLDEHSLGNFS